MTTKSKLLAKSNRAPPTPWYGPSYKKHRLERPDFAQLARSFERCRWRFSFYHPSRGGIGRLHCVQIYAVW